MRVFVTQQHIDAGTPGSCNTDPIALAMKDAGCLVPWVSPSHLAWNDRFHATYSVDTPGEVLAFMQAYDNGRATKPFEFELRS
jgi:hypothetical protein